MMMRLTSSRRPGAERLEQRVVFGVDGQDGCAGVRRAAHEQAPAQTRHSLLASATVAPRSIAASVGFNPIAPLIAAITQSAGRCAASMQRVLARPQLRCRCRTAPPSARHRPPDRRPRQTARRLRARASPAPPRCAARSTPRPGSGRGSRLIKSMVLAPIEPVAPRMVMHARRPAPATVASARVVVRHALTIPADRARRYRSRRAASPNSGADQRGRPETVEPVHHAAMARE